MNEYDASTESPDAGQSSATSHRSQEHTLEARDISATNVVSGNQYNIEQQVINQGGAQQPLSLTEKQRKRNHARMLERVQAIWINGVLEPSVQGAAQITLELQHKPSAVVTPLWHVLREFDKTGRLSSADASIVQVYDHASGEVLILGEPGAGKTTLLLELTRDLLERARQDEAHPIPVVFPLSSWATRRQPLTEWLASELHSRYQVPLPLATSWIETDQVLPLLDGLDEVAALHRAACVEAINTYRQAHGLLPTVVCSRQTDYLAFSTRLLLRTAVVVQSLTHEQIETYLASAGEQMAALRKVLHDDPDLQALASTPLMLNVLTVAYQGIPHQEMTAAGSLGMKREHVFASYVQRMLTRRSTSTPNTPKQTIHWLAWLARQMRQHNQTVFYLEQLQPSWLSGNRMLRVYGWLAVRGPGVLMGVLLSLVINLLLFTLPLPYLLIEMILLGGLLGGLLCGGSAAQQLTVSEGKASNVPWHRLLQRLGMGVLIGLSIGLSNGLIFGLSFGLIGGILSVLRIGRSMAVQLTDRLVWSWRSLGRSLLSKRHVSATLQVTVLCGLLLGLSGSLVGLPTKWLSVGLSLVLCYWLLLGLFRGVSGEIIEDQHRVVPNQGIRYSAFNGLVLGLVSTMIVGLSGLLSDGLGFGLIDGLNIALSKMLSNGVIAGLSADCW